MNPYFSLNDENLKALDANEAVEIFRQLLMNQAFRYKVPLSSINVPSKKDAKDGGIDAYIENAPNTDIDQIIREGYTAYQIKTGTTFDPKEPSKLREELIEKTSKTLKKMVKECLDNSGTYILVCFGLELTKPQILKSKQNLKKIFQEFNVSNPKIEIWTQSKLRTFIQVYPAIVLDIKKQRALGIFSHQQWALLADMNEQNQPFKAGELQSKFIEDFKEILRVDNHIHIDGEPGVGKTRLVLEATKDDELSSRVIYCDDPEKARALIGDILINKHYHLVLIVDECDQDNRAYILRNLLSEGSRIKLVTIYNEEEKVREKKLVAPSLGDKQIVEIFNSYGISENDALYKWASLCNGSPRVAHVLGSNLRENPDDVLKSPNIIRIWDRYIANAGHDRLDTLALERRKRILTHIALFRRFGYEKPFIEEAKTISFLLEKNFPGHFSWSILQEEVQKLKARKILQGRTTLYITPKALHLWLWCEWWNNYGNSFNWEEFYQDLTPTLTLGFNEMFRYAAASEVAQRVVEKLLGPGGPFNNYDFLDSEVGASFFRSLTEANPKAALNSLISTLGTLNPEELLNFKRGRRQIIWALERIVIWKELFVEGTRLLLALGEAENERISNNASGIFVDLFTMGWGELATTQASPEERFLVLEEALFSSSKPRRLLALKAINRALGTRNFSRTIGAEYQGLRIVTNFWVPKTHAEWLEGFSRILKLLINQIDRLENDERLEAISIILGRSRELSGNKAFSEMLVNLFRKFVNNHFVDRNQVLSTISEILAFEAKQLPDEIKTLWVQLRNELTVKDFPSMLQLYLGKGLIEDYYDEAGNYFDKSEQKIRELAKQAVDQPKLLSLVMEQLVNSDSYKVGFFGLELSRLDENHKYLPEITAAQKNSQKKENFFFLGAYLRNIFEKDVKEWLRVIKDISSDSVLVHNLPELVGRSGFNDEAALLILELAKKKRIELISFYNIRISAIHALSEVTFVKILTFLLETNQHQAIKIALSLLDFYFADKNQTKTIPVDLALSLLTHPSLGASDVFSNLEGYFWAIVALMMFKLDPDKSFILVKRVFEFCDEDPYFTFHFTETIWTLMNEMVLKYPEEVWKQISVRLGPPFDRNAFSIKEWLTDNSFFYEVRKKNIELHKVFTESLWNWIDQNIEERAWFAASFIPKDIILENQEFSITRELLSRYGGREEVRRNLIGNYISGGYTGLASIHYSFKKKEITDLLINEKNRIIRRWLNEYVAELEEQIKRSDIYEERRF